MTGDNACLICGLPVVPNDAGLPHRCLSIAANGPQAWPPITAERQLLDERAAHACTQRRFESYAEQLTEANVERADLRDRLAAVERERDEARAHPGRADTDCDIHGQYVATTCIGCADDLRSERDRLRAVVEEVRELAARGIASGVNRARFDSILARCDAVLKEEKP